MVSESPPPPPRSDEHSPRRLWAASPRFVPQLQGSNPNTHRQKKAARGAECPLPLNSRMGRGSGQKVCGGPQFIMEQLLLLVFGNGPTYDGTSCRRSQSKGHLCSLPTGGCGCEWRRQCSCRLGNSPVPPAKHSKAEDANHSRGPDGPCEQKKMIAGGRQRQLDDWRVTDGGWSSTTAVWR